MRKVKRTVKVAFESQPSRIYPEPRLNEYILLM